MKNILYYAIIASFVLACHGKNQKKPDRGMDIAGIQAAADIFDETAEKVMSFLASSAFKATLESTGKNFGTNLLGSPATKETLEALGKSLLKRV